MASDIAGGLSFYDMAASAFGTQNESYHFYVYLRMTAVPYLGKSSVSVISAPVMRSLPVTPVMDTVSSVQFL